MTDLPAQPDDGGVGQTLSFDQSGVVTGVGQPVGQPPTQGEGKEQERIGTAEPQTAEVEEIREPEEVPEEVEGWVERVERGEDVHLVQPVTHAGQVLVEPARPKEVKIVLPLSEEGIKQGLHVKLVNSLRWLAEWCLRLVKKLPGKVVYRSTK